MSWLSSWFSRAERAPHRSDRELASTFRRALLAVLENDYDAAESLITEAVHADSEDIEPYRSLARLYRLRGEIGRAIRIHQNLLLRDDVVGLKVGQGRDYFALQLQEFVDAVRHDRAPSGTGEDGKRAIAVTQAATDSLKSHRAAKLVGDRYELC